jgi:hypothetical protein
MSAETVPVSAATMRAGNEFVSAKTNPAHAIPTSSAR